MENRSGDGEVRMGQRVGQGKIGKAIGGMMDNLI